MRVASPAYQRYVRRLTLSTMAHVTGVGDARMYVTARFTLTVHKTAAVKFVGN